MDLALSEVSSVHSVYANNGAGTMVGAAIGMVAVVVHRSGTLGPKAEHPGGGAIGGGAILLGGLIGYLVVDRPGSDVIVYPRQQKKSSVDVGWNLDRNSVVAQLSFAW